LWLSLRPRIQKMLFGGFKLWKMTLVLSSMVIIIGIMLLLLPKTIW
jgi:hypothetical protein